MDKRSGQGQPNVAYAPIRVSPRNSRTKKRGLPQSAEVPAVVGVSRSRRKGRRGL